MRPLRKWQIACLGEIAKAAAAGGRDFLASAAPSTGKTGLGLAYSKQSRDVAAIDAVVIIAPSILIQMGWIAAAAEFGLKLSTDINASDVDGYVLTYQSLTNGVSAAFAALCATKRVMIITDEVHHAGLGRSWGDAVRQAADEAVFRLGLSGTAWRTDDADIPFMHGDAPHFTYSYGEALRDGAVASGFFRWMNGSVDLSNGRSLSFDESVTLSDQQVSRLMKSATAPGSTFSKELLAAAHSDLMAFRKADPTAGGLVICDDIKAAREAMRYLTGTLKASAVKIDSEEDDPHKKLEAFKTSRTMWVVSVAMVAEGVDIPRLKVLAYLSNNRTQLSFEQAFGRVTRLHEGRADQNVLVHLPKLHLFEAYAENIEASARLHGAPADDTGALAPQRVCAQCGEVGPAGALECRHCGHVFPVRQTTRNGAVVTNTDGFPDGMTMRGQHFTEAQIDQIIDIYWNDDEDGLRQKGRTIWASQYLGWLAEEAKRTNVTLDAALYAAAEVMRGMPNRPACPDHVRYGRAA